jgi:thiol:disulfide interchange protein
MRVRDKVAVLLVALTLAACGRAGSSVGGRSTSAVPWEKDLAAALKRAGSENKVVMVDFYTDWCKWCDVMDQKTFSDAAVLAELRRVIPVKLDAEREGRDAARRYRVQGFPTILFLDAEGREVGRIPGFVPAEPFLEEFGDIVGKG